MSTITVHPANKEQANALLDFMNTLKIKYEVTNEKEYDPAFVTMVKESRRQAKEGKIKRGEKKDFKKLLGLT